MAIALVDYVSQNKEARYISPRSPPHLHYISPTSPHISPYLTHISSASPQELSFQRGDTIRDISTAASPAGYPPSIPSAPLEPSPARSPPLEPSAAAAAAPEASNKVYLTLTLTLTPTLTPTPALC